MDAGRRKLHEKMEDQHLVSHSQQCSSAPVGFGQGFLNKEQCHNTVASSMFCWTGCCWFLPVFSTEISIKEAALLWCCWRHWECDGRAEKAFTKWLPGALPTHLQSLAEVRICTMGLFRRKWNLNDVLFCIYLKWSDSRNILELPPINAWGFQFRLILWTTLSLSHLYLLENDVIGTWQWTPLSVKLRVEKLDPIHYK